MDFSHLYELVKNYNWKTSTNSSLRNGKFRKGNESHNVGKVRLFRKGLPIVDGVKMKKNKYMIYNECERLFPKHEFTGIMINKNFKCPPHVDSGNEGEVIILGLGDYEGGELVYNGVAYDIRNKATTFVASEIEHYVKDFTGDRYSVVLFKHKTYNKK